MLRRWLDPPEVRERKRRERAAGIRPKRWGTDIGIAVPLGCLIPIVLGAAVLVGVGVLIGTRLQAPARPTEAVVRVIDSGAPGGPRVVSTQVVPVN